MATFTDPLKLSEGKDHEHDHMTWLEDITCADSLTEV